MTRAPTDAGSRYHHGDLRRALLEAAESELSENGIEGFSLRGVAKRAGVSHGAPAHHFSDVQGLLTALAAIGFERFVATQELRQRAAQATPEAQLAASGLGYVDFAVANPALFRLMFSSERPDMQDETLAATSTAAFDKLVKDIQRVTQADPYSDPVAMTDVLATWAIAHGLANLVIAGRTGRMSYLQDMAEAERDEVFAGILLRAVRVAG